MKMENNTSILATDFSSVGQNQEDWLKDLAAKQKIYQAFSEYIACLENDLIHAADPIIQYAINQEIKKVKKEQKKYYVSGMLEEPLVDNGFNIFKPSSKKRNKSRYRLFKI